MGDRSDWASLWPAHPLSGPCGPLLSLAHPLLRAEAIRKGHSQLSVSFDLSINSCNELTEIAFNLNF